MWSVAIHINNYFYFVDKITNKTVKFRSNSISNQAKESRQSDIKIIPDVLSQKKESQYINSKLS